MVSEAEVETFLSTLRSGDVDKRINLVQLWGIKLETEDALPDRAIDAITMVVAPYLRSTSHLLVVSTLSFLPSFLPLVPPSTGTHLRLALAQLLQPLLERLNDQKDKLSDPARECIALLGRKCYEAELGKPKAVDGPVAIWEGAVRETLAGRHARAKLGILRLLCEMRNAKPTRLPLKPWLSGLVNLLEDSDGTVRDQARETVITLLSPPSTPDAARTELKRLMGMRNVRKSIKDAIEARLFGDASPEPAEKLSRTVSEKHSRSGAGTPAPLSADEVDIVYITSDHDLLQEFRAMLPHFQGKETEHNWGQRERAIIRIRGMLRGRVFAKHPAAFLTCLKGGILEGFMKTLMSLRTTVAQHACALVQELADTLGPSFDPSAEYLLPTLGKMAGFTKRIIADRSQKGVTAIITHSAVPPAKLIGHISAAVGEKSVQARQYGVGHLRTFLDTQASKNAHVIESTGLLPDMEVLIKRCLADLSPQVREQARLAFWSFDRVWPSQANVILNGLDGTARKQLEKANPQLTPTPATKVAPSKLSARKPRPSTGTAALIAAKRAAAAKMRAEAAAAKAGPVDMLLPETPAKPDPVPDAGLVTSVLDSPSPAPSPAARPPSPTPSPQREDSTPCEGSTPREESTQSTPREDSSPQRAHSSPDIGTGNGLMDADSSPSPQPPPHLQRRFSVQSNHSNESRKSEKRRSFQSERPSPPLAQGGGLVNEWRKSWHSDRRLSWQSNKSSSEKHAAPASEKRLSPGKAAHNRALPAHFMQPTPHTSLPRPSTRSPATNGLKAGSPTTSTRSGSSSLARTLSHSPPSHMEPIHQPLRHPSGGRPSLRAGGSATGINATVVTAPSESSTASNHRTPIHSRFPVKQQRAQHHHVAADTSPTVMRRASGQHVNAYASPPSTHHSSPRSSVVDPVFEAHQAQRDQAMSAVQQLLEFDDDQASSVQGPITPMRSALGPVPLPAYVTPVPMRNQFNGIQRAVWEDSPKPMTPKLLNDLKARKYENSWWTERKKLLEKTTPLKSEDGPGASTILADIAALSAGEPSVRNLQKIVLFSQENPILSEDQATDDEIAAQRQLWEDEGLFDRTFDGLTAFLDPSNPSDLLEHGLVALWELVENQWPLCESREDALIETLFRLRASTIQVVLESTNAIMSLLDTVSTPPFLMSLLRSALDRYIVSHRNDPSVPATSDEVVGRPALSAGYTFGLNAMGMCILKLPKEAVEVEARRLEALVMDALALKEEGSNDPVAPRQAAFRVILAVQCKLGDDVRTLALFPRLDNGQRSFVTYLMEQHGLMGESTDGARKKMVDELIGGLVRGTKKTARG